MICFYNYFNKIDALICTNEENNEESLMKDNPKLAGIILNVASKMKYF